MNSEATRRDDIIRIYLSEAISFDGYDLNLPESLTLTDKFKAVDTVFKSEYQYRIDHIGYQNAMREWLAGLPTCVSIAFYNSDIIALGYSWQFIKDGAEDKFLDDWFQLLASKLYKFIRQAQR